ncbi:hypothetical protein L963_1888 [Leuconostoc mesenteroides subsp. cremoris T26]|nr:hypothetical protein L963_1888 [Leuconostoc mesenteroides subsp. cremoris T26]
MAITKKSLSAVCSVRLILAIYHTLILRQDGTITKRTQIIFIVISVALGIGMAFAF